MEPARDRDVCSALVVDDDQDDAVLAARAIRTVLPGCHVRVARSGVEALAALKEATSRGGHCCPFSFVLLDLHMAGMDGFDVLDRIRSDPAHSHLAVVVFTCSGDDESLARSYHLGATSYIRKPVDHGSYSKAVAQIAAYWSRINTPHVSRSR
jgi:two-component system response regulator